MNQSNKGNLSNYVWSFANSGGTQIIGFFCTALIARIASPTDFGLIAICASIILICNLLSEAGLSSLIVINKDFSIEKASTILITVSFLSFSIFLIVISLTNHLAILIGNEKITYILPIMSFSILANGLKCVHSAILSRNLELKKLALISLFSISFGSATGLLVAYLHDPLIGLAIVFVLNPILNTFCLWIFAPWGFNFSFKPKFIYSEIGSSFYLILSSGFDEISKALMTFLLNGRFGISDLGFYSRADAIKNLSSQTLDKVVQRVSFPTLSKQSHINKINAFEEHIKISFSLILILVPVTYFLSFFSKDIISIIYGPNWTESALILNKLAFVGIFLAITSQNITFFKALSFLKIMMINKALALCLLPLVFFIYISDDLLKLLEGFIFFSISLFVISTFFLLRVDFKYAISYLKNIFFACFISISIIFFHFSLLKISLSNMYLNVFTNGISLFLLMIVIYYFLYLIFFKK